MAINTEIPISKVTLDDQEISLASSGGGEEMKQETYAGTELATITPRVCELFDTGKLLSMDLTFTTSVKDTLSDTNVVYDLISNTATYETLKRQYSAGTVLRCIPSQKSASSTMLFDASSNGVFRSVQIASSRLRINEKSFYYELFADIDEEMGNKIKFYDKRFDVEKEHFTVRINYME
jgi:hypothetical protein